MPSDRAQSRKADSNSDLVPLDGSNLPWPADSQDLGPADVDRPIAITVHVRSKSDAPSIDDLMSGAIDEPLSLAEYEKQFGASQEDIDAVADYCKQNKFKVVDKNSAQCMIELKGKIKHCKRAFNVELKRYDSRRGRFFGHEGLVCVPEKLDGIIEAISGLDSLGTLSRVRPEETIDEPSSEEPEIPSEEPETSDSSIVKQFDEQQGMIGAKAMKLSDSISGPSFQQSIAPSHSFAAPVDEPVPPGYQLHYPSELAKMYGFPEHCNGEGETIGIISLGGYFHPNDMRRFFKEQGLATPKIEVENVGRNIGHRPPSEPGPPNKDWSREKVRDYINDFELTLDLQVAGSVAPGAKLVVYRVPPSTKQPYLTAIQHIIHSDHCPSVLSISYGSAEGKWSPNTMQRANDIFARAARMHITICASSGDAGSASRDYATIMTRPPSPHVNFPASSPFVLACGGTQIETEGGRIVREYAWNDLNQCRLATAGGISKQFKRPPYQKGLTLPKDPTAPKDFDGRGIPDVAANASLVSGYRVLFGGRREYNGGTSAVAPFWAGLIARINQGLGRRVGFMHPYLYRLAGTPAFRDITEGSNGYYQSGPGWDACTGNGVPVGQALLDALDKMVPTTSDRRNGRRRNETSTPSDLSAVVGAANSAAAIAQNAARLAQSVIRPYRIR